MEVGETFALIPVKWLNQWLLLDSELCLHVWRSNLPWKVVFYIVLRETHQFKSDVKDAVKRKSLRNENLHFVSSKVWKRETRAELLFHSTIWKSKSAEISSKEIVWFNISTIIWFRLVTLVFQLTLNVNIAVRNHLNEVSHVFSA